MPSRYSIIAVDGPSGVGKSTLMPLVAARLAARGVATRLSSNIDSAPFGPAIRELMKDNAAPYTVALATAAARAFLWEQAGGAPLLCDRFVVSTLVYQDFAGVPRSYIWAVNGLFAESAVHVVLRIEVAELERRRAGRGRGSADWFKQSLPIGEEVRRYAEAAAFLEEQGQTVMPVDAGGSPEETAEAIAGAVAPLLGR